MSYGLRNTRLYIPTPAQAAAGGGAGTPDTPSANALKYYCGGFAVRGKLTRGIGWLTGWFLVWVVK